MERLGGDGSFVVRGTEAPCEQTHLGYGMIMVTWGYGVTTVSLGTATA